MQIMKYKWQNFEPFLVVKDKKLSQMPLLMKNIDITLGKRICTGHFKDGKHVACPESTETDYEHICNACRLNDDFYQCIQCDGATCVNGKRRKECMANNYYIYLATFDDILKVGISFEHRINERLVEQGADFGAKIGYVKDGQNVRIIEQQISKKLGIVDRVRGEQKHKNLFGDPNKSSKLIFDAVQKLKGSDFLMRPEIYDLRSHYHLHNVLGIPKSLTIKDNTQIKGKVVAAKGNIIVLKNNDDYFSVNAHALIGREILQCNDK
jgi:hypothetical protein